MAAFLYADEQFPLPVVKHLREMGYDVLTVQEAGKAGQGISDSEDTSACDYAEAYHFNS